MFQIAGKDRSNLSDAFKPCGGLEKPSQRLRASAMSFDLPGMWDTSKVIPDEATKRLKKQSQWHGGGKKFIRH